MTANNQYHTTLNGTPLSTAKVRVVFLDLLRYASRGGMEEKGQAYFENIALLFDQLVYLVAAAEALHQESGAPDQYKNKISKTKQKGEPSE